MPENVTRWKAEGILRASSPLSHGGRSLGTNTYMRREKFLLSDGKIEEIPVVSGNAVRGALRDYAADMYFDFLGRPDLPLALSHLLWSGGAITKARSEPLSGSRLRDVKRLCPPLSLFGGAGSGRIINGCLTVGKALPVCTELAHLLPESISKFAVMSHWDLVQLDEFSRFPDREDSSAAGVLMRYGCESFITGTPFHVWCSVAQPDSVDLAFVRECVSALEVGDIQVGGSKGQGYGKLSGMLAQSPEITDTVDWREVLIERGSSIGKIIDTIRKID